MKKYDYLIVGAGLFGCVCAERLVNAGHTVLVVEKLPFVGGTCYSEDINGIHVHKFGAHIFRTNHKEIYEYFDKFAKLNAFINSPIAIHRGRAYNLPFNMNTFAQIWPITRPEEAKKRISDEISKSGIKEPRNLAEKAITLAGKTIFDSFIKEYTEKQWGRPCEDLPADIIRRIPLRFTYDNNYYDAKYQGIPSEGYTKAFERMLKGATVMLNTDFLSDKNRLSELATTIIYTGPIDEYFGYCFGELEYRGLRFDEIRYPTDNWQGNAVVNYSDKEVPFTRTIEHKHFTKAATDFSIVSYEYPCDWHKGEYPYYPINDLRNTNLYLQYKALADQESSVVFGGRLGLYQYFDMQDTIISALKTAEALNKKGKKL